MAEISFQQEYPQKNGDILIVKEKNLKQGYYNCFFKIHKREVVARKDRIIKGEVANPQIEIDLFKSKLWPQTGGELLKILEKTDEKEKHGTAYLWKCIFTKYPYEILATSSEIKKGRILNPRIEEEEFKNKVWKQIKGDLLSPNKRLKENYWECLSLTFNNKIIAQKDSIIKGKVLNPKFEEIEFKNKIWKQKYDSLKVLEKTELKEEGQNAYLWKCTFIKYPCIIYERKSSIIRGTVDNPNYPWRTKEGILKEIFRLKKDNKKVTLENISNSFGISESWIGHKIIEFGLQSYIEYEEDSSLMETKVYDFIKANTKEEVKRNQFILDGKEIDIFIPSKKFGFEYNGNYWHSSLYKDKNYHQQKSLLAQEKGIRLIHIFEYEWLEKQEILKSLIKSRLGVYLYKIGARKCEIKEIKNYQEYASFCNNNHLQGEAGAKVKLGLYYNNELIQIMSFGSPRFSNNFEWEIIRECSKKGYCILGGKEKLWEYFVKNYSPKNCISYCDFSKFTGESYLKLGFELEKLNKSGFVWWDSNINQVFWRDPYHNQEMKDKGYLKIYDCGQLVFTWKS